MLCVFHLLRCHKFFIEPSKKMVNDYMKGFVPEEDLGLPSKVQSTVAHTELAGLCPQLPRNKTAANKSACLNFRSYNLPSATKASLGLDL